jgi:hypothetical protein
MLWVVVVLLHRSVDHAEASRGMKARFTDVEPMIWKPKAVWLSA